MGKDSEGLMTIGKGTSYVQQGSVFQQVSSAGWQSFLLLVSKVPGIKMAQARCQGSWMLSCPEFK